MFAFVRSFFALMVKNVDQNEAVGCKWGYLGLKDHILGIPTGYASLSMDHATLARWTALTLIISRDIPIPLYYALLKFSDRAQIGVFWYPIDLAPLGSSIPLRS
jgi:hypothetical protein